MWKVPYFVSCQKLLATVVNVVQGERELVKTSDKVYCLGLVQRFMLRHSELCMWGPFTITTHLCAWAWGGSHKMAHLAIKRITIFSLISHEAHIGASKSFGFILNYRFKVFLEILRYIFRSKTTLLRYYLYFLCTLLYCRTRCRGAENCEFRITVYFSDNMHETSCRGVNMKVNGTDVKLCGKKSEY